MSDLCTAEHTFWPSTHCRESLRERREWQEEREGEAEALGVGDGKGGGEKPPLFLPTPSLMASAGEE